MLPNQINILWIEDNPIQQNVIELDGMEFPSFEITNGNSELFSFKLFQHPMEIFEYLSMISDLNQRNLSWKLSDNGSGAIPDIVVFDYKLSDNFDCTGRDALSYTKQRYFLLEHSASHVLKQRFPEIFGQKVLFLERKDVVQGDYKSSKLQTELKIKRALDGLDDEFGLFAGIGMVREFKNYITLGVPATLNKHDPDSMSENSLFYEWLNTYDLKDAIQRPDKANKNWDDILRFALPLLRKRIVNQVAAGKITPDFFQLVRLLDPTSTELLFSFTSMYGEKHMPLEGLFLDKTETVEDWAGAVFEALRDSRLIDIENVIDKAKELWQIYLKEFEDRMQLSNLHSINKLSEYSLSDSKKKTYARLLKTFGLNGKKARFRPASVIEFFEIKRGGNKLSPAVRLAVLYLAARAEIELNFASEFAAKREIYGVFSEFEYFNFLFPRVIFTNEDITLPMHVERGKKKPLIEGHIARLNERLFGKAAAKATWYDFGSWIEPGERKVLRSVFYEHRDRCPDWLK